MYIKKNADKLAKILILSNPLNDVVGSFISLGKKDAIITHIIIVKNIPGKKHSPPRREAVSVCTFLLFGLSISLLVKAHSNILGMQYHTIQKHKIKAETYNEKNIMLFLIWLCVYFNKL